MSNIFEINEKRISEYKNYSNAQIIGSPILIQPLMSVGSGVINFFGTVRIGVFPSPYFLNSYAYLEARNQTSSISIDDGTHINNGLVIIAEFNSISIGKRCVIGCNVEITDSDFHGISPSQRHLSLEEWTAPVTIGDDCFIGSNVKILKGVVIGSGSTIANGSIVAKNVPPLMVFGGNPARVLKSIRP